MEAPRLFRVWSEDQKTYDYKFPYNSLGQFYISESGVLFSDFGNTVAPEVRQEAFVIEWFTGHYDKNGKPIYTGDIVECILGNKPIVFHDCRYWLGETLDDLFDANLRYDIEIVGTVNQNPELLEENKKIRRLDNECKVSE